MWDWLRWRLIKWSLRRDYKFKKRLRELIEQINLVPPNKRQPLPDLKIPCIVCGKPAVAFLSPLSNPDEPALCQKHFGAYCDGLLTVV